MAKDRRDFINVRLSDAALDVYGHDQEVRIVNAHSDYTFTGDVPVEVVRRGEWDTLLSRYLLADGAVMFQEAALATNSSTESEA